MALRIINLDDLKKQVTKAAMKKIEVIALEAIREAQPQLATAFIKAFRRTIVGQSLLGKSRSDPERDAAAHLGFYDDELSDIRQSIEDSLRDAIEIAPTRRRYNVFSFSIKSVDISEKLLEDVDGSYESDGGTVPWLEWLIHGGQVDATILFDLSDKSKKYSRSERALMVGKGSRRKESRFANKHPWDIDEYGRFAKDENFVVDMTGDETWKAEAASIAFDAIARKLKG